MQKTHNAREFSLCLLFVRSFRSVPIRSGCKFAVAAENKHVISVADLWIASDAYTRVVMKRKKKNKSREVNANKKLSAANKQMRRGERRSRSDDVVEEEERTRTREYISERKSCEIRLPSVDVCFTIRHN